MLQLVASEAISPWGLPLVDEFRGAKKGDEKAADNWCRTISI